MALNEAFLAGLEKVLEACDQDVPVRSVVAALRERLQGLVILLCDAADVLEEPWRSYPAFDVHLVDTSNHCTEMALDPATATGLLFAVRERVS